MSSRNVSRSTVEAIVRQLLRETNGSKEGVVDAIVAAFSDGGAVSAAAGVPAALSTPVTGSAGLMVSASLFMLSLLICTGKGRERVND